MLGDGDRAEAVAGRDNGRGVADEDLGVLDDGRAVEDLRNGSCGRVSFARSASGPTGHRVRWKDSLD